PAFDCAIADAGALDAAGDADILRILVDVFHSFERHPDAADAFTHDLACSEGVAGIQNVPYADIPAIDAHFFREQIHDAFHRELSPVAAKAAHGAAGRIVCEYGLGLYIHVGHAIDAAGMARRAQQTLAARARVASRIAHNASAHGEQMAFRVRANLVF